MRRQQQKPFARSLCFVFNCGAKEKDLAVTQGGPLGLLEEGPHCPGHRPLALAFGPDPGLGRWFLSLALIGPGPWALAFGPELAPGLGTWPWPWTFLALVSALALVVGSAPKDNILRKRIEREAGYSKQEHKQVNQQVCLLSMACNFTPMDGAVALLNRHRQGTPHCAQVHCARL